MTHLVDIAAIALLIYGLMHSTPTEIRETIKSYLLITAIFGILFVGGFWLLLFMASSHS